MSDGQKILIWFLMPFVVIGLFLDIWGLYYITTLKDNFSLTTLYVDEMQYSEDEKYFIELQYFPNMFEAKVNYYTDTSLPEFNEETQTYEEKYTHASGVQFDGGYQYTEAFDATGFLGLGTRYFWRELENCSYYNTDNSGTSYSATNSLKDQNKWIYDANGQLILLKERGYVKTGENKINQPQLTKFGFSLMLESLYKAVESLEVGKRVISFDLSKYFTFQIYDEEQGKFVKPTNDTTETWTIVNVYVNKHSTDFVSADQSVFGMFMGDPNWTLYDLSNAEFWRARHEFNIGIESFTIDYIDRAYYLKLQQGVINFLNEFKNMQLIITIDLDNIYLGSQRIEVVGFTDKPFGTLDIDTIYLRTTQVRDFSSFGNYNIVTNQPIPVQSEVA